MYHKIIFTYLTPDIKNWLWLWDLILNNISGDASYTIPLIFFPLSSKASIPRFPMTPKALTKRVPLSPAKIIFSAPSPEKIWQI